MSLWLKKKNYFWQWHCMSSITLCCSADSSSHLPTVHLKALALMFSMSAETCFAVFTAASFCKKCLHLSPNLLYFCTFWMAWADNLSVTQSEFFSPGMSEVLQGWFIVSETHLLHWTGRVCKFRILYRNTLLPLFCHVVDLLQLLLAALLSVQQRDFIELLDICGN